jgi:hypothetical protein
MQEKEAQEIVREIYEADVELLRRERFPCP